jgi:signal transduction histidine kinase
VADTGPGIAPEYHQDIFCDFFQVPDERASNDGMGLGLGIARRLVHAHGGKLWVESEAGNGCKFSFLIPLRQNQESE